MFGLHPEGSKIGQRFKRTGDLLLGGARKQVTDYKGRFEALEGIYDDFLSRFICSYHDSEFDVNFIDQFFGKRELRFAGIDGTICKHAIFDLLIFFAGAYSSQGSMVVGDDGCGNLNYEEKHAEGGIGISSVLPIYINEVPKVDQSILARDEVGDVDDAITFSDSWIIDNAAFADYLMGLAEFYLAFKMVTQENPVDILLLDRIFSAEVSSFYAETSEFRVNLDHESGLIGVEVEGRKFSKTDWIFARRLFGSFELNTPPPRGEYLLTRVIRELMKEGTGGLSREQLIERLGLDSDWRKIRLDRELEKGMKGRSEIEPVIIRRGPDFILSPNLKGVIHRVRTLLEQVCERIFSEDPEISYEERFKIDGKWITTNDLAFLSLVSLYLAAETAWTNRTLLIGVAKDTSARDLKRQVLPVLNHTGFFKGGFPKGGEDVPDTDRMILQWVSLKERDRLKIPWATCEYDAAFKTTIPHYEGAQGLVSGARKNQISLNRTFIKSYFQLAAAKSDPRLRSNVLLYDRLAYPEFDNGDEMTIVLKHDYGGHIDEPEPVEMIYYGEEHSPIQKFIIQLFSRMTSTSIPELFGHLKPLFIADKIAKYYYSQFSAMVNSTAGWLLNRPELREFIFYLSSFRERRTDIEQTRKYT